MNFPSQFLLAIGNEPPSKPIVAGPNALHFHGFSAQAVLLNLPKRIRAYFARKPRQISQCRLQAFDFNVE